MGDAPERLNRNVRALRGRRAETAGGQTHTEWFIASV